MCPASADLQGARALLAAGARRREGRRSDLPPNRRRVVQRSLRRDGRSQMERDLRRDRGRHRPMREDSRHPRGDCPQERLTDSTARSASERSPHLMKLAGVILIIAVALFFDYTNGFHDAANSIATVVSTRVLTPRIAVVWAAAFNFIAFLIFGTHVANTVGKPVDPKVVSNAVVFAGLIGAITGNLI